MSTSEQKYFLGIGGVVALHFSNAAEGIRAVRLSPITAASFNNPETGLLTFGSAAEADVYKDKLCTGTAAAVNRRQEREYVLEDYCTLEVQHLEQRSLEVA